MAIKNSASQIASSVDKSNSALQAVASLLTEIIFFLIRHDKLGLQQIIIAIIDQSADYFVYQCLVEEISKKNE